MCGALLLACKGGSDGGSEKLIEEHRAAATAKLDAIAKVADDVRLKGPTMSAKPADPAPDFTDGDTSNAVIVIHRSEEAPDNAVPLLRESIDPVAIVQRALGRPDGMGRTGRVTGIKSDGLRRAFERVESARYALIVVPITERQPSAMTSTFSGGMVKARAHLVDIASGDRLVAFDITAGNSEKVLAERSAANAELKDDLSYHYGEALLSELKTRMPDAKAPSSFGFTAW